MTEQTTTEITPEQIAQRIADLKTAGEAYRLIWTQVQEAEAALNRAYRLASDLKFDLIGMDMTDEFSHFLYEMSNQIGSKRSDLGFFEQRVNSCGSTFRRNGRELERLMGEMPNHSEHLARHFGLMSEPKKENA